MDDFTFPASALTDALASPLPATISLDYRSGNESWNGFVIGLGGTFVMLQNIEAWHNDGILIIPLDRIEFWEQGPAQIAQGKILSFNTITKLPPPEWVNLSSLVEMFWSLRAKGDIICLAISDYAEVGQVVSVSKHSVILKGINAAGEQMEDPVEAELSDIRYVQFDDEYTAVLSRYTQSTHTSGQS